MTIEEMMEDAAREARAEAIAEKEREMAEKDREFAEKEREMAEKKYEMVKKMKTNGVSLEDIAEYTELSIEEIKKL